MIIKDYKLRSVALKTLLRQSTDGIIPIAIPKVVFEEVVNKWREEAETFFTAVHNTQTRLGLERGIPSVGELMQQADRYARWLETHLNDYKVRWLDIPDVSHEVLLRSALRKRKPFKENGAGYRDALIWESVKQLAKDSGGEVLFLSYDKNDFASKQGDLHPDLVADLQEDQLDPYRVRLMTDAATAVEKLVNHPVTALKWFTDKLRDDESYKQRVIEALANNLDRSIQILDQDFRGGEVVRQVANVRAIGGNDRVVNAWVIETSRIGVELEIDAEIDVLLNIRDHRAGTASVVAELDPALDESTDSQTVHGRIIGQLELPENPSDEIFDAYAYISSVSDRE